MIKQTINKFFQSQVKLHVGCGTLYKDGWVNIDNDPDNNIEKLDINHDLSKGMSFDKEYVYNKPELISHLSKAGFKFDNIIEVSFGMSEYNVLQNIDTRIDDIRK